MSDSKEELCDLCGLSSAPFEQGTHLHCLMDENIRADIQYLSEPPDSVLHLPPTQVEGGSHDSTAP